MPLVRIREFRGRVPQLSPLELNAVQAQVATNVKLWSKTLRPYQTLLDVETTALTGFLKTIYLFDSGGANPYWCAWNDDVDVVRGPIPGDTTERTYFTGSGVPQAFDNTMVNTGAGTMPPKSTWALGLPAPVNAPSVSSSGGSGTAESVNYVYTYVSAWGEEGPPSPPSNTVNMLPGGTNSLTSLSGAPGNNGVSGYTNITTQRLYRSSAGVYEFVADIPIANTTYSDSAADSALGEAIPSTDWVAPPSNMVGLTELPNAVLAGFADNVLYLCEPGLPYAWPVAYQQTMEYPIVGIAAFGTTVVVATTGAIYLAIGGDPASIQMVKLPAAYTCVSKRGMVAYEDGVLVPTTDGLVHVGADGHYLKTTGLYSRDEWQAINPSTLQAAIYDGQYIAFYQNGLVNGVMTGAGFALNLRPGDAPEPVDIGFYAFAPFTDPVSGNLYLVVVDSGGNNHIQQWDAGPSQLSYTWKSKRFRLPIRSAMAAGRVSGNFAAQPSQAQQAACAAQRTSEINANEALLAAPGGDVGFDAIGTDDIAGNDLAIPVNCTPPPGIVLNVYGDEVLRASKTVYDNDAFALPAGYLARDWEMQVSGTVPVEEIEIATSMRELGAPQS